MGVVAGQPIRSREQKTVEGPGGDLFTQAFQAGAMQGCAAEAVIAENEILGERPALRLGMRPEAVELLINSLGVSLVLRRDAHIQSKTHQVPPAREPPEGAPPARGA